MYYKFTDQELDQETGLYNYGARLYDPIVARFVTPDPYLSANIVASICFNFEFTNKELISRMINPQNLNRYAYVLNNPMKLFDPLGLEEQNVAKAYSKLHNGHKIPNVDIPWRDYGKGIADWSRSVARDTRAFVTDAWQNLDPAFEAGETMASGIGQATEGAWNAFANNDAVYNGLGLAGKGTWDALANNKDLQNGLKFSLVATARVSLEVAVVVSYDVNAATLTGKFVKLPFGLIQYNTVSGMMKNTQRGTEILSRDLQAIKAVTFRK
jgi:RHS repeat-associated protein